MEFVVFFFFLFFLVAVGTCSGCGSDRLGVVGEG